MTSFRSLSMTLATVAMLFPRGTVCAESEAPDSVVPDRPPPNSDSGAFSPMLDEMVVRAVPLARLPQNMPASVSVVTPDSVHASGAVSIDEMLVNLVGIDTFGNLGTGSEMQINLRGLTPGRLSKRTLVLVDGRRVKDVYQGGTEFGTLAPDAIERIEVFRGPASHAFGSGAQAGVLNIVTRTGAGHEIPFLETRLAGGSDRTLHARAVAGGQEGAFDALAVLSRFSTDGYLKTAEGRKQDLESWNAEGNIRWSGERDTLRLHLGWYDAEGREASSDRTVRRDHQNAVWQRQWDSGVLPESEFRIVRSAADIRYDWMYPGLGQYDLEALAVQARQTLALGERIQAVFGVDARDERADIRDVQVTLDRSEATFGAFGEADLALANQTTLSLGLRWDKVEGVEAEWSPRVGLLQKLGDEVEVYGSVGQSFRAPGMSDRYAQNEYMGMMFVGNPDLDPETITAYEVGARFRFEDRVRLEATLFHNDLKDSFDFVLEPDGVFRNRNVTSLRNHGLELSTDVRLGAGFHAFAHYSWTDGSYGRNPANPTIEGRTPAYMVKHRGGAGLAWVQGRQRHGFTVRYDGPRYGDAQNSEEQRISSHGTVDWRSRVPVTERLLLTLNIDNVLDRDFEVMPGVPGPGARFLAGAEMVF